MEWALHHSQGRRAFARWNISTSTPGNRQFFAAEQLTDLPTGVLGPGATVIDLDISLPVAESGPVHALALIGQRQVVVGVSVARRERDRFAVRGNGFIEPLESSS